MTRYVCVAIVLLLAACQHPGVVPTRGLAEHPSELSFPPLRFEAPRAADYRTELPNGMVLYIAENRELPTFDMEV
ncbi:MAG: hypothetical protein ACYTAF_15920, partial [Planctomycetota bacterium]